MSYQLENLESRRLLAVPAGVTSAEVGSLRYYVDSAPHAGLWQSYTDGTGAVPVPDSADAHHFWIVHGRLHFVADVPVASGSYPAILMYDPNTHQNKVVGQLDSTLFQVPVLGNDDWLYFRAYTGNVSRTRDGIRETVFSAPGTIDGDRYDVEDGNLVYHAMLRRYPGQLGDAPTITQTIVTAASYLPAYPPGSVHTDDTLYFTKRDATGAELWRSNLDGSDPLLLKRWEGASTPGPRQLMLFQDKLYFLANYPQAFYSGIEPWTSDGTPEGTFEIQDIYEGSVGSNPHDFVIVNNHLLFQAKGNSQRQGVYAMSNQWHPAPLNPGYAKGYTEDATNVHRAGDRLYFYSYHYATLQLERWQTDGTTNGTFMSAPAAEIDSAGVLRIFGSNQDDQIHVTTSADGIVIGINGVTTTYSQPIAGIQINALRGNDAVIVDASVTAAATINGGEGNDTIQGGSGNDSIYGGDQRGGGRGADRLDGGAGDDFVRDYNDYGESDSNTLLGGDGNDTIIGSDASEVIDGGTGIDSVELGANDTSIIPAATMTSQLTARGVFVVLGTDADETILVRRRASKPSMLEVVVNGAARSFHFADVKKLQISAAAGNDTISFDPSLPLPSYAVQLAGDSGNDVIYGSSAADRISGGDGDDWINAGPGNDTIYGDGGNDKLYGGDGKDYLIDTSGQNVFRGGTNTDRIVAAIGLSNVKDNKGDLINLFS